MIGSLWVRLQRAVTRLITGQSLRARLASLTGISVAASVLLVGGTAFVSTRLSLLGQLDQELTTAAHKAASTIARDVETLGGLTADTASSRELVALTSATGEARQLPGQTVVLAPTAADVALARMQVGQRARSFTSEEGVSYRLVSVPIRTVDTTGKTASYAVLV